MTFKKILPIHESEYLPKSYSHWKRYITNTEGYPAVQKAYSTFPGQVNDFREMWLNASAFGCFFKS